MSIWPTRVYFIKPVGMDGPIKIGCSSKPTQRLMQISHWSPFPLEVILELPGDHALEANIHQCFADAHTHFEWFLPIPRLTRAIDQMKAGVPVDEAIDLSKRIRPITKPRRRAVRKSAVERLEQKRRRVERSAERELTEAAE